MSLISPIDRADQTAAYKPTAVIVGLRHPPPKSSHYEFQAAGNYSLTKYLLLFIAPKIKCYTAPSGDITAVVQLTGGAV